MSNPNLTELNENSASFKRFEKVSKVKTSNIPSGLDTFMILQLIKKKDPMFSVPVPDTIVMNCGFNTPTLINYDKKIHYKHFADITDLRQHIFSSFNENFKSGLPLVIIKFRTGKKIYFSIKDLFETFPDISKDFVIQKYIPPKGLKAIKYRVIINNLKKVYIYSNKVRIDAKHEQFQKKPKIQKNSSFSNFDQCFANHKEIANGIKTNQD